MLRRRSLLAAPLALLPLLAPLPAVAQPRGVVLSPRDQADIARIEAYLNATRAIKARFLQIAPDGGNSTGTAWLVRPGRMRFQYDPPAPFLLVGGNGLLVFHDSALKQTSNVSLNSTPIGVLLQDNLRFSGEITIVSFVRQPGQIQVGVVRTRSPQDGVLTLIFSDNPLSLRQWTVLDPQRNETRVILSDVQVGGSYPSDLFQFVDPRFFQNNSGGN